MGRAVLAPSRSGTDSSRIYCFAPEQLPIGFVATPDALPCRSCSHTAETKRFE